MNVAAAKEKLAEKKEQLLQLTGDFSKTYLNEEYEVVVKKLIDKMARKRDVPFIAGKIEIWAAAIIHALGTVNFLFDESTQPYASVTDINEYFHTNKSTVSQKSKKIRDMFNMSYFDSEFATESVKQENPLNNMSMINGLLVPNDMIKTDLDDGN
ncbi:DUF6398 domain-containing protein [Lentibacillus daqui]|uniref:DUF6398 domain-containing protein n=1 Tax=Lentibacillus daqui TaxID=2911514 RepID=UPI0022B0DC32|nr:DUF6398 domain-containing protein [Lentibacillus daqui]